MNVGPVDNLRFAAHSTRTFNREPNRRGFSRVKQEKKTQTRREKIVKLILKDICEASRFLKPEKVYF